MVNLPSPCSIDKQLNARQVSVTVIHTCTIALTVWRLWYKTVLRRWWWEDLWAAVALVAVVISEASVWILSEPPSSMSSQATTLTAIHRLFRFKTKEWPHRSVLAGHDYLHHRSLVRCPLSYT